MPERDDAPPAVRPHGGTSMPTPNAADPMRALQRLRQLASEIRSALARNDLEIVCQAAGLLLPALAACRENLNALPVSAGESVQMALDTQHLLAECESLLNQAMKQTAAELRRLRRGKNAVSRVRPPVPLSGKKLDTRR